MAAIIQEPTPSGAGRLGIALFLIAPSLLALFASYAIGHGAFYSASALWLVYECAFYLGAFGAILAIVMTVVEAAQHRIAVPFVWLIGIVALAGIWCDWYAFHIYRSPWSS
jgi:hypothetical protein